MTQQVTDVVVGRGCSRRRDEHRRRCEKERGGSSRCILLLVAQKGKRSRQRSGAFEKRRASRGGLHFGNLDPGAAKDWCSKGGELKMGIRKRADSYKGVIRSVLDRHEK